MKRRSYSIKNEPAGRIYERLVDVAGQFCTRAILVTRPSIGLEADGRRLLEQLKAFNGDEREASEWPGTQLLKGSARVLTFDLNQGSRSVLKRVPGLYSWKQPERPEDLSLLRPDGSTWLASVSHEKDAFLELDDAEAVLVQRSIPEMSVSADAVQQ